MHFLEILKLAISYYLVTTRLFQTTRLLETLE